ncbi:MAG: YbhB/YbcL family Raf kinase inhibitor-like protein [Acidobacteria bacterium]|nr:YbhB/YbcL family Raf kinase inhibitor-like protein [Acidobacteriota bacterium]MCI0568167.1 YbhB/YbcL family Raf kinase inhibitor-like protein [Acidobacteriota bacterium]MCI0656319.1 YbhB/YbcL family Raf kinase inhibitor-like protein [Acidobacteriota bacterium]
MKIESAAFAPEAMIPSSHTCDGEDVSPPLTWADPPDGTKSFALISDDPDAPGGTWVHWVVWNIPPSSRGLAQGAAKSAQWTDGTRQGITDFRRVGYGGPCPPSGTHRYFFRLYALDTMLDLASGASRADLDRSMRGHVLAQADLMGKYRRS